MKLASRSPSSTRACALALALAGVAACSLSQEGVMPPADTFFFPSAGLMTPTGNWLYVANSNADLRYNDGTLVRVNAQAAADARDPTKSAWSACPQADYVNPLPRSDAQICCWDALDSNILNCDERLFIQPEATVRIGSFAASMIWQDAQHCTTDNTGSGRIFIGVRGDTSVTWADVNDDLYAPTLNCSGGATGSLLECTQKIIDTSKNFEVNVPKSNLASEAMDPNAPVVGLPDEPYALEVDSKLGLLYVGHLVGNTSVVDSGGISLFDVGGAMPVFVGPFASPFPPNGAGSFGVTAITRHPSYNGGPSNELFVSSRYVPVVQSMVPFVPGPADQQMTFTCAENSDVVVIPASETLNTGLTGSEMRGVAFLDPDPASGTPQRVFALQRVPPALVTFDITTNHSGAVIPVVSSVLETCSSPTFLYRRPETGPATRLYVNCFDTGEIYVFDPTIPALVTNFQAARGPSGIVFDTNPARQVAYVLDFSHNDVAVMDVKPGSPTEDHVIQRLGFPTVSPR